MSEVYTLTGRAARWIQLLHDFGHVDQEGMDRLYVAVAELAAEAGHPADRPVDVDLVRRAAAILLLPDGDRALTQILEEDWSLLFG